MASPNTFKMTVNLADFGAAMAKVSKGMHEAVRPAAQAGSQVLYDEVIKNVSALKGEGRLKKAIYQVYSGQNNNNKRRALYVISWRTTGKDRAPHGWLVEYGYIQRYQTYKNRKGEWKTMARPENRGKKAPNTKNRKVLDAFYMPRTDGPVQWRAHSFIRNATDKMPAAREAMRQRFAEELRARGVLK